MPAGTVFVEIHTGRPRFAGMWAPSANFQATFRTLSEGRPGRSDTWASSRGGGGLTELGVGRASVPAALFYGAEPEFAVSRGGQAELQPDPLLGASSGEVPRSG